MPLANFGLGDFYILASYMTKKNIDLKSSDQKLY